MRALQDDRTASSEIALLAAATVTLRTRLSLPSQAEQAT
jgi:hypothetical protein